MVSVDRWPPAWWSRNYDGPEVPEAPEAPVDIVWHDSDERTEKKGGAEVSKPPLVCVVGSWDDFLSLVPLGFSSAGHSLSLSLPRGKKFFFRFFVCGSEGVCGACSWPVGEDERGVKSHVIDRRGKK